jgi:hypothetical protein
LASTTLRVRRPDVEIAGPEVDLNSAREYGSDGSARLTGGEARLDQADRAPAVADLNKQASAELPMRLASDAVRAAVECSFALPLIHAFDCSSSMQGRSYSSLPPALSLLAPRVGSRLS